MPFTFSHPAIVLPLSRWGDKYFSITGLIIGSLTPDFGYFIRMQISGELAHSYEGILLFNLPVGILLSILFHQVVRNPLINYLPIFRDRFIIYKPFNWIRHFKKNWLIICISIIIGTCSHLFWDSFTHQGRYFTELWPALQQEVSWLWIQRPIFNYFQHFSTLIGACFIYFFIYKMPKHFAPVKKKKLRYWAVTATISISIFCLRIYFLLLAPDLYHGDFIVTGISAGMLGLLFASMIFPDHTHYTSNH